MPNYYPDSRYDTDNTDNVSLVEEENVYNNRKSVESLKDKSINELFSYDENIVLTTNSPLYDILKSDGYYGRPSIPPTLRGVAPYFKNNENYFSGKPQSLPVFSDTYLSDLSLSDTELQDKHANTEPIYDRIENNVELYEIDCKSDNEGKEETEQNNNESKYNTHSDYVEENPLYEVPVNISPTNYDSIGSQKEAEQNNYIEEISVVKKEVIEKTNSNTSTLSKNSASTKPEVEQTPDLTTIVQVDPPEKQPQSESELETTRNDTEEEKKQHSHNYLKELFETQKGCKKPLQNFISKKISRAFGDKETLSRRNSKLSASDPNLSNNLYCSLPDADASKNLRKCEKIDRKLRKCDRSSNPPESRFIVNIGRHFDVTANANVPVDFEVKISKVPKAKGRKTSQEKKSDEKSFLEAVKNLKHTLNSSCKVDENHNISKPEIVSNVCKDPNVKVKKAGLRRSNSAIDRVRANISVKFNKGLKMSSSKTEKEFQEKLGSMRNYWDKMVNGTEKTNGQENDNSKSKQIDVPSKVEEVIKKFEPKDEKEEEKPPGIVQMTKQIFEPKPVPTKTEKLSPLVKEACGIFENPYFDRHENGYDSLSSNAIEIVGKEDGKEGDNKANKVDRCLSPIKVVRSKVVDKRARALKTRSMGGEPEFDHVRYKVMKSELFQKKIFANCEKESQFDGLMQYLQDYSFQELLIDNNIVIIEPIRSKVSYEATKPCAPPHNVTPLLHKSSETISTHQNTGLRRHFFYHPIRVNKEVNDNELPNPDTVKQVRQFFETRFKRSRHESEKETSNQLNGDPDKDHCSEEAPSETGSQDNLYDSLGSELCCEQQYVSEDVLEKIRERGTTITYYGGRVVDEHSGRPTLTKAIMDEIKGYEERNHECKCADKDAYQGLKFKLLKSNSCSSRMELVGTNNLAEYRKKFLDKQKQLVDEHNLKNKSKGESDEVFTEKASVTLANGASEKDAINEKIRQSQPKIVGTEMKPPSPDKKMMQWNERCEFSAITFNNKPKSPQQITYDYHVNEKIAPKPKQIDDMEFEPYEIAGS